MTRGKTSPTSNPSQITTKMISAFNLEVCIGDKPILKGLTLDVLASEMKAVFLSNEAEAFR